MNAGRALVAGWFSFEGMGATAGDRLAAEVAAGWVREAGLPADIAVTPALGEGVDWASVDPCRYTHLLFVCGPLGNGEPFTSLHERFGHCRTIGLDLSMLHPTSEWQPFDTLLERDSDRSARPDLSFAAPNRPVPVVAFVLVHEQREYREAGRHRLVHDAIARLRANRPMAAIDVDTCLDPANTTGLRSPAEVEAIIARADVVVTTRLHGLVLALRNGVPAVAVDPVAGGAKVARQAATIGWPVVLTPGQVTDRALGAALDTCLDPSIRSTVDDARRRALAGVDQTRRELLDALSC